MVRNTTGHRLNTPRQSALQKHTKPERGPQLKSLILERLRLTQPIVGYLFTQNFKSLAKM